MASPLTSSECSSTFTAAALRCAPKLAPCSSPIPVAALGQFKVITVDYRMAPEAVHPAAVEDLEIVYRELLKTYAARNIGIYGCSAGGALTAQAAAWLPAHGLPSPGAIGIFGAGAVRFYHRRFRLCHGLHRPARFPRRPSPASEGPDITHGYFAGADMNDRVISPALHADAMAEFPPDADHHRPRRAMDMSPGGLYQFAIDQGRRPARR